MNKQTVAILPVALAAALATASVAAQQVYKSIDASGQVTYTDVPTGSAAKVEQVELPPGPTPEEVLQARQDGERISAAAEQMQAERLAKERERTAQREKAAAEAEKMRQVKTAKEQLKRNRTMVEYYGYRDWRLPEPVFPEGTGPETPTE